MKLSQLSLADYNKLDNIPVVNQDLSATDFTPVANTYYKHIGTTTDLYTNGVIYYYNSTGYAALDGSASGLATVAKTGSYNDLSNIPVISQDLTASGFTPVANTYYRHTGATTDTFTQGVIYLYDTAYHKLGESGGDYLTYKGDWVTNTAYNVNDVVTWKTNGHLYKVIKAHTSSSTIDPSNAEYYKAMTSKKVLRQEFPGPIASAKSFLLKIYGIDRGARITCIDLPKGVEIVCRFSSNMCISGATFDSDNDFAEFVTIDFTTGKVLYQQITATNTTTGTDANAWQILDVEWEE